MSNAFGVTRTSQINIAIAGMRTKATTFTTIDTTSEELLNAFVRAEDRDLLVKAAELVSAEPTQRVSCRWPVTNGRSVYVSMGVVRGLSWLVPSYVNKGRLADDCPPEFEGKLSQYANRIADTEIMFGMIYDMFSYLNRVCTSPEQVRFYFGGIVTLLKWTGDEQAIAMANKLRENRMPRSMPKIPTEMRDFCIAATRRLSMVMLLPEDHPTPPVVVGCGKPDGVPLPWDPSKRCTILT